jgi:hypothetical protein
MNKQNELWQNVNCRKGCIYYDGKKCNSPEVKRKKVFTVHPTGLWICMDRKEKEEGSH